MAHFRGTSDSSITSMAASTAHEDISPTTVRPNIAAFDDESRKQSGSWRRPVGFGLLAIVVVAWTASGFLTSVSRTLTLCLWCLEDG